MAGDNLNKVAQIPVTEVELYQIRDGYPLEPKDKPRIYKRGNVTIDGIKLSTKPKKIRITYTELLKLSELRGHEIDPYPNLRGAAWNKKMDDWKRVGAKSDEKRAKEIRKKMGIESDGEDENEEEEEEEEEEDERVAAMAQDIAGYENDEDEDDEMDGTAAATTAVEEDEDDDESVADMAQDIARDENDEDEDDDMDGAAAAEEDIIPVLDGDIEMDEGQGFGSVLRGEVGLGGGEEDNEDGITQGGYIAAAAAIARVRQGFHLERTVGEVRVQDDPDARRLAEGLHRIGAYYPFGGDKWDSPEWWG